MERFARIAKGEAYPTPAGYNGAEGGLKVRFRDFEGVKYGKIIPIAECPPIESGWRGPSDLHGRLKAEARTLGVHGSLEFGWLVPGKDVSFTTWIWDVFPENSPDYASRNESGEVVGHDPRIKS